MMLIKAFVQVSNPAVLHVGQEKQDMDKFSSVSASRYNDVPWALWHLKSQANQPFVQQLVQANSKENIKGPYYWPFVKEIK